MWGDMTMSEGQQVGASKADVEKVRDLFGLAHDLIAQAEFPGHVSPKVAEVMQFLAYQYNDFKGRAEVIAKAELSTVDVEAAKTATDAALAGFVEHTPKA